MTKLKKLKINNGSFTFEVVLKYEERNRLKIAISPSKEIGVKAPQKKSEKEILKYLIKKTNWIRKQLDYFDKYHPLPEKQLFISGATHLYLGKQYRLKISQGTNTGVKLVAKFFYITVIDKNNSSDIQKKMENWYRHHAHGIINKRVKQYLEKYNILKKYTSEITLKKMKKRWGSLSKNKKITINLELIKAPIYCIDYVIVHELCHLIFPDHSVEFYKLLTRILPDWKIRKEKLEKVII